MASRNKSKRLVKPRAPSPSTSEDSGEEQDLDVPQRELTVLEESIVDLSSPHPETRQRGLGNLQHHLRTSLLLKQVLKFLDEILDALFSCVHKGNAENKISALSCLNLVVVTLGNHVCNDFLNRLPLLLEELKAGDSDGVRSSVAETIAVGVFASSPLPAEIAAIMHKLARHFCQAEESVAVKLSAVKGWGLLASLLPANLLLTPKLMATMPTFKSLLSDQNLDVKIAAAENIAILYEARWRLEGRSKQGEDAPVETRPSPTPCAAVAERGPAPEASAHPLHPEAPAPAPAPASAPGGPAARAAHPPVPIWDDPGPLLALLDELCRQSSKRMSKADRARQHAALRPVRATVAGPGGGGPPRQQLRAGDAVAADAASWAARRRLDALRAVLRGGLQAHLAANPWLRDALAPADEEDTPAAPVPAPAGRAARPAAAAAAGGGGKGGRAARAGGGRGEREEEAGVPAGGGPPADGFARWLQHAAQVKARALDIRHRRDQCRRARFERDINGAVDG